MKVTFYLGDNIGTPVNASSIEFGNPGVGGTQYVMLLVAHFLNQKEEFDVNICASRRYDGWGGESLIVKGDADVVPVCENRHTDILVLKTDSLILRKMIQQSNLKVVYWSHNYIYADLCSYIANTPQVKCNVFVSKEQYDRYIDNNIIKKSTFIYNLYNDSNTKRRHNDSKTICYMGAIVPAKGFRELCRIWKGIKKQVPEATLLVLGSGSLYGTQQLGKYNIASDNYESQFVQFIKDADGEIDPSIKFLGVVGEEKISYFLNASVGVVNPTAVTETFGMGILEMASACLPVATIGRRGYLDTIIHNKTGLLASSLVGIQKNIVRLLSDKELNNKLGDNAKVFISKFSPTVIIPKWESLLNDIYNNELNITITPPTNNFNDEYKWIRYINYYLRFKCHLKILPSILDIECFLVKLKNKILDRH